MRSNVGRITSIKVDINNTQDNEVDALNNSNSRNEIAHEEHNDEGMNDNKEVEINSGKYKTEDNIEADKKVNYNYK